jgi:hypothetical protein
VGGVSPSKIHEDAIERYVADGWLRYDFRKALRRLWSNRLAREEGADEGYVREVAGEILEKGRFIPDAYRFMERVSDGRVIVQCIEVEYGHRVRGQQLLVYSDLWFAWDSEWSQETDIDIELYHVHADTGTVTAVDLQSVWWREMQGQEYRLCDVGAVTSAAGVPVNDDATRYIPHAIALPISTKARRDGVRVVPARRVDALRNDDAPLTISVCAEETNRSVAEIRALIAGGALPVVPGSPPNDRRVYRRTLLSVLVA